MQNLISTEDGSVTLLDGETGELYHNKAGAFTEAFKNYVEPANALDILREGFSLRVMDACFGLGYNTWVLLAELATKARNNCNIYVLGIELNLLNLTYLPEVLQDHRLKLLADALAAGRCPINFGFYSLVINQLNIELEIRQGNLREEIPLLASKAARFPEQSFDLVFHDPFSPNKIPELWTVDLFKQYYQILMPRKGKLLTYSAAAAVRGGLGEAGFAVYKTTAVGAKSGGTLATCDPLYVSTAGVSVLEQEEIKRVSSKSGVPYRDPSFTAFRKNIQQERSFEQNMLKTL